MTAIKGNKALKAMFFVLCVVLAATLVLSFVHIHPYDEQEECLTCEFLAVIRSFFGLLTVLLPLLYLIASLVRAVKRIVSTAKIIPIGFDPVARAVRLNN